MGLPGTQSDSARTTTSRVTESSESLEGVGHTIVVGEADEETLAVLSFVRWTLKWDAKIGIVQTRYIEKKNH